MLISTRFKFIWLANPKTGTTAIKKAFTPYSDFSSVGGPASKHTTYLACSHHFSSFMQECEVVVCVRDPLETLYSWYRYRSRPELDSRKNSTKNILFGEFVESWASENTPSYAEVDGSSVDFILAADGSIPDISIFRYGVKPSLHEYLEKKVGRKVPELKENVSPVTRNKPLRFTELVQMVDMNLERLKRTYDLYQRINFRNDCK